jgi:RNA polymerase primary sigma factor
LVTANLRFGVAMAESYQGRGISLDELISAANQGLIEAADRFDSRNGARFITYASWWIRRYMGRALDDGCRPVYLPSHIQELIHKVQRAFRDLYQTLEHHPGPEDVAAEIGESVERVLLALRSAQDPSSLDHESDSRPDGERRLVKVTLDDVFKAPNILDHISVDEEINLLLTELPDREAAVVRRYYGLEGNGEGNLAEIGREMHLRRERVRQIKASAMRRLRLRAQELTPA